MRGGFAGCAASAINPTVSSTATTMFDKTAAFLIAHLMLEAITQAVIAETIFTAEGKPDLSRRKGEIRVGLNCNANQSHPAQNSTDEEIDSILPHGSVSDVFADY
jgi:hypothetical protein